MKQYLELLKLIKENGHKRSDRTGTGTTDLFGPQFTFDLRKGFPLLTTKKINFQNVVGELIWILSGSTNDNDLREITYGPESDKQTIWEQWAHPATGELGPIYGKQLRKWNDNFGRNDKTEDQLKSLLINLEHNPFSRRHVVSLWNASDLPEDSLSHRENIEEGFGVLPPCHCLFQFHVHEEPYYTNDPEYKLSTTIENKKHLSCKLYQRSADFFIGVPYNIASYALLTHLVAHHLDMVPHQLIHTFGSAHIYSNHYQQVETQLKRKPGDLPRLIIKGERDNIWDYEVNDFKLEGYNPQDWIQAPVAI